MNVANSCPRLAVLVTAGLVAAAGGSSVAMAQQPMGPATPPQAGQSGWTFNVAPYLWLPWLNINLSYNLPNGLGGRLPTSLTVGPGEIVNNLRFGAMLAAEARHDRLSVLTDVFYANEGFNANRTKLRSVDFFGSSSQRIPPGSVLDTSSVAKTTVWTLAGGYTALRGDWGNLDVIAGIRLLSVNSTTGYRFATTFTGPGGNPGVFGGAGSVSASRNVWNAIGGFRGRLRIPNSYFFIPYYFDIGGGDSNLTWQAASGIGYQSGWAGLSAQYRYLSFEQGGTSVTGNVSLSGPMVMVNVNF